MTDAPRPQVEQAEIVPICGNCRFHGIDEHGGGRNRCLALEDPGLSERYKYRVAHTCDTPNAFGERAFKPNYFHLDGLLDAALRREAARREEETGVSSC